MLGNQKIYIESKAKDSLIQLIKDFTEDFLKIIQKNPDLFSKEVADELSEIFSCNFQEVFKTRFPDEIDPDSFVNQRFFEKFRNINHDKKETKFTREQNFLANIFYTFVIINYTSAQLNSNVANPNFLNRKKIEICDNHSISIYEKGTLTPAIAITLVETLMINNHLLDVRLSAEIFETNKDDILKNFEFVLKYIESNLKEKVIPIDNEYVKQTKKLIKEFKPDNGNDVGDIEKKIRELEKKYISNICLVYIPDATLFINFLRRDEKNKLCAQDIENIPNAIAYYVSHLNTRQGMKIDNFLDLHFLYESLRGGYDKSVDQDSLKRALEAIKKSITNNCFIMNNLNGIISWKNYQQISILENIINKEANDDYVINSNDTLLKEEEEKFKTNIQETIDKYYKKLASEKWINRFINGVLQAIFTIISSFMSRNKSPCPYIIHGISKNTNQYFGHGYKS